jgi:proline iminopeptidase
MKLKLLFSTLIILFLFSGCKESKTVDTNKNDYLDFSKRDDQATGGIKMIPISTPIGNFNVWTKRVGYNPKIKVLLLHGGPGGTHEFFECFDGFFSSRKY